ncbi:MAG: 3-isopropylmalate dehydratase small subunit [Rhodospirillaceae bacterium]|jgi:3-isopropylmalate/(R)-2-methylmalate dehydratase small subunit|nr:3-isopropylmalate dehydratase small subunit [Rhodospirillaceae bacterium]MBT5241902.1 3-isopropylmalate dehydratase small subunit [Rhodospirillaceae bacterium]MBT5567051.1 3-isopropylmalate dehydratase small subunit [Rhodospirillaceae bacterium]MBT6089556.1 3-isopropylmalate dehydratase small subunit [Rhodospirillaceae bacterium]MBT6960490.1 3-isopropylmalate dehydratase small subunit [Rhodospirillaceae bacterium]
MDKFTVLTGVAAALPMVNIDTDMIMPKQFLKTIKRTGLGTAAFFDMRYDESEAERPEFILNQAPYRQSKILLAGRNFGCGSSREHAPWGLLDFGFRCMIAPSFADIFYNNCFKNGILCVTLPEEQVEALTAQADGSDFTVDLDKLEITAPDGSVTTFELDPTRRHNMLNGLDDIALTLEHLDKIKTFEAKQQAEQPWLYT